MNNIQDIKNDELFSLVFSLVFEELDGYNVEAEVIAKGCADLARTIRERSQYERRSYYQSPSDLVQHIKCDPDLKYLGEMEWDAITMLVHRSLPFGNMGSAGSVRDVIGHHCFVVEYLDGKIDQPIELVYYSTK